VLGTSTAPAAPAAPAARGTEDGALDGGALEDAAAEDGDGGGGGGGGGGRLCEEHDFLWAYATTPGTAAYRGALFSAFREAS